MVDGEVPVVVVPLLVSDGVVVEEDVEGDDELGVADEEVAGLVVVTGVVDGEAESSEESSAEGILSLVSVGGAL